MNSTYILFYSSFFIAFLVCVAILEDDDKCQILKQFGIGQLVVHLLLTLFILMINTIGECCFLFLWCLISLSFHQAGVILYKDSYCTQTLADLLLAYLYACIAISVLSGIALFLSWCYDRGRGVVSSESSPPKKKKVIQQWISVLHQVPA